MKKIILIGFLFLLASIWVISCCKKYKPESIDPLTKTQDNKKIYSNPNGDSELAILMRTMMQSGKTMKNEIENKLPISPYPSEIKSMTTAKQTDGMIEDRAIFNALANFHIITLDSIYIKKTNPTVQFNHMVKSCVDCHENYCHGPIPAIKQLYISVK